MKHGRSIPMMTALSVLGLLDSVYLTIDSYSKVVPYCPVTWPFNCGKVTQSPYSHPYGIPVALLGLLWFAAMVFYVVVRPSFGIYLIFPLWLASIAMVGYLVYVEAFLLDAVCIYCTLAHVCTIFMGIPIFRLTFSDD